jgi:hypothetical protein
MESSTPRRREDAVFESAVILRFGVGLDPFAWTPRERCTGCLELEKSGPEGPDLASARTSERRWSWALVARDRLSDQM